MCFYERFRAGGDLLLIDKLDIFIVKQQMFIVFREHPRLKGHRYTLGETVKRTVTIRT